MMVSLVRKLLFIPAPVISKEEALRIAATVSESEGWFISNPRVIEELKTWMIWVRGNVKGSPFVVVDQQTGEVVRKGCPFR